MTTEGVRRLAWAALAISVLHAVGVVTYVWPRVQVHRSTGFAARVRDGAYVVTRVNHGTLAIGDRILAVNGRADLAASPQVSLSSLPPGGSYAMTVERRGTVIDLEMEVTGRPATPRWWSMVLALLSALTYTGAGVLIALKRPADAAARWAALCLVLLGNDWLRSLASEVGLHGWIVAWPVRASGVMTAFWTWPALHFLRSFPTASAMTPLFRLLSVIVLAAGAFYAIAAIVGASLQVLPPPSAPFRVDLVNGPLNPSFQIAAANLSQLLLASVAAWRWRTLKSRADRARLAWLFGGIVLGAGAVGLSTLLSMLGRDASWLANVAFATPFFVAYALVHQRVMGFAVVIRRTVQYLFARPALESLLVLPLAVVIFRVWRNPNVPARELFQPAWGLAALTIAAVMALLLRRSLLAWLDRRFFRAQLSEETALRNLIRRARTARSVNDLTPMVCEGLAETFQADLVEVALRASRSDPLEAFGTRIETWEFTRRLRTDAPVIALPPYAAPTLPDAEAKWFADRGVVLAAPIRTPNGQLVGVILLGERKSQQAYGSPERATLVSLATQIGLLYENRLLDRERTDAILDERNRIARDLHDSLAQGFAGIGYHLDLGLRIDTTPRAQWHMDQARNLARESLTAARNAVHDIRTLSSAGATLPDMITALAHRLELQQLEVRVSISGDHHRHVPADIAVQIFRIAQEATTNVVKHARASSLALTLEQDGRRVTLRVADDGCGFDSGQIVARSFGMAGMRERAAMLGATLEVDTTPGSGTEIRLIVELPDTHRD